ncbi:MAG: ribonuclease III [Betaproteobacteria bacterium]|nr:MAG: ribonuclease III [Betaproteobacteria bacterium]
MRASAIERKIGHRFQNRSLLNQALTHRSYGVPHNERLEFLGDSILNCVIANLLYERYPEIAEGELSRVRANLVNQQSLADLASHLDLGEHVMLGHGEIRSGGSRRPSIQADALEALLGAVFLDAGFETVSRVIVSMFGPFMNSLDPAAVTKDPKTRLQEFLQGRRMSLPSYTVVDVSGQAHDQLFRVECRLEEMSICTSGEGASRRAAEQDAAEQAYTIAKAN